MNCSSCGGSRSRCGCPANKTVKADFVLVGLGTAGAALAWGLTNNPDLSVLAIEAGADTRTDPLVTTVSVFDPGALYSRKYHWSFPADPRSMQQYSNVGLQFIIYEEGRMWGGSSGHNFLLAVRGSAVPYGEWASVDPRWSYNALLPTFRFLETYTPLGTGVLNPAQRGTSGPLFVTQDFMPVDPLNTFVVALGNAGMPYTPDYNDPSLGNFVNSQLQVYVEPTTFMRSWAASAFLGPAVVTADADGDGHGVGGRKLEIKSNAVALRLLFKKSGGETTVIGVRYIQDDQIIDAMARKKVILCAGGVSDPLLLQGSGIGPAALLADLGIDVVVNNPNVGANLQDHYGPIAFLPRRAAPDPTLPTGLVAFSDLQGPNVGPGTGEREFQLLFQAPPFPGAPMGFLMWNLQPSRLGTVTLQSTAPDSDPIIAFHFYESQDDIDRAVRALKMAANISLDYSGMMPDLPSADLYPLGEYPGGMAAGDSGLVSYLLNGPTSITNHNSGTCRMATSAANGVVDGDLNVFGVQGLSVCSNAIAPTIEDGNTAWCAYIIGLVKARIEGGIVPTA